MVTTGAQRAPPADTVRQPRSASKRSALVFFIAIHYNTFKISNLCRGFEVLITMTIYCSVVQWFHCDSVVICIV